MLLWITLSCLPLKTIIAACLLPADGVLAACCDDISSTKGYFKVESATMQSSSSVFM